ncbi:O-antigen ligase family protein [Parafilimonas sp.]|uniref:O-antigen ligase family protein n=1 Tax=Parafilimonas sp. TaxID=1969739 RepID=UPI0039E2F601
MQSATNTNKSLLYTLLNEPLTFFGGLLLFLMVFSPTYNMAFKIVFIIILLITVICSRILFDKLNVTKEVFLWYAILISHGIFFTIIGFLNKNNPYFVLRTTTYNIIWPVFYFIFTIGLYKRTSLIFLIRVLVITNFIVSLYLIGSALTLLHVLPPLGFLSFSMSQLDYDTTAGLVKVQIPAIISMMFTVPFLISFTLLSEKRSLGFKKWFLYASILLSIIGIISSARRALMLNVFFGVLFTIIFSWWANYSSRRILKKNMIWMVCGGLIILTGVLIAVADSGFIDLSLVFQKFSEAFASKENLSDKSVAIRYDQFDLLIKSWLQKPLLGHGHGAVSSFVVRSEKTPWMYELSYVALLFQTGIIGLLIYLALLGWPIYKGLTLLRKGNHETALLLMPLMVGCTCFLIANGTNPYLQSYDNMWTLFFPVAVINYLTKELSCPTMV